MRLVRSLASLALCLTASCHSRSELLQAYLRAHPDERHQYFLWQQCPEPGWSRSAALAALGTPDREESSSYLTFSRDGARLKLSLLFEGDVVRGWGAVLQEGWRPTEGLLMKQNRIEGVNSFLAGNSVPDSLAYRLYQACPWVGMPRPWVTIAMGPPSRTSPEGTGERYWFALDRHGNSLSVLVEGDSVSSVR